MLYNLCIVVCRWSVNCIARITKASSTLSWRNLKTVVWLSLKTHQMVAPDEVKNAAITGYFGLCLRKNSVKKISWLSWSHRFGKAPFWKCFPSTRKWWPPAVFEYLSLVLTAVLLELSIRIGYFALRVVLSYDRSPWAPAYDYSYTVRVRISQLMIIWPGLSQFLWRNHWNAEEFPITVKRDIKKPVGKFHVPRYIPLTMYCYFVNFVNTNWTSDWATLETFLKFKHVIRLSWSVRYGSTGQFACTYVVNEGDKGAKWPIRLELISVSVAWSE